jgi:ribulose kinase
MEAISELCLTHFSTRVTIGGATENRLMMQHQSDMLNLTVIRPEIGETTALGAAFAAGLAVGLWKDLDELTKLRKIREKYEPRMPDYIRERNWHGWQKAVARSLNWIDRDEVIVEKANPSLKSKSLVSLERLAPYLTVAGLALGIGFVLGHTRHARHF